MNISKKLMLYAIAGLSLSQNTKPMASILKDYKEPNVQNGLINKPRYWGALEQVKRAETHNDIGKELPFSNSEIITAVQKAKNIKLSAAGNGKAVSVMITPFNDLGTDEITHFGTGQIKRVKTANENVEKKPYVSFSIPSQFSTKVDGKRAFFPTEYFSIQINNADNELLRFDIMFDSLENNETFYITSTGDEDIPMLITQNGKPNVNAIAPAILYQAHADLSYDILQDDDLSSILEKEEEGEATSSVESSSLAHLTDKENSFDSVAMPS